MRYNKCDDDDDDDVNDEDEDNERCRKDMDENFRFQFLLFVSTLDSNCTNLPRFLVLLAIFLIPFLLMASYNYTKHFKND
jgi:hypothetical protein